MHKLVRQWHVWGSVISLFAIVIFFATGYFMQVRRDVPMVMPTSLQAKAQTGKKIKLMDWVQGKKKGGNTQRVGATKIKMIYTGQAVK